MLGTGGFPAEPDSALEAEQPTPAAYPRLNRRSLLAGGAAVLGATAPGIAPPGVAVAAELAQPAAGGGTDALPAGFIGGALSLTGDWHTAQGDGAVDGTATETSLTNTFPVLRRCQCTVAERGG
jgi:hypothetical protein